MIDGKKSEPGKELKKRFPALATECDYPLARHTTIGCGNRASVAAFPKDIDEAERLLTFLQEEGIAYIFLGAGANVLPSDGYFQGVVVKFNRFDCLKAQGNTLFVGAGVTGGALLRFARARELSGVEPFTMIPMTIGGGITMNAGVRERHFCDIVKRVTAIEHGKRIELTAAECAFREKESIFQKGIALVGAELSLTPSTKEAIERERLNYASRRRALPKGRSMGCTFVNPENQSAGRLIDACGLKGFTVGKAHVSPLHANFIMNEGTR